MTKETVTAEIPYRTGMSDEEKNAFITNQTQRFEDWQHGRAAQMWLIETIADEGGLLRATGRWCWTYDASGGCGPKRIEFSGHSTRSSGEALIELFIKLVQHHNPKLGLSSGGIPIK
jgi:hypothetical protein